MKYFPYKKTLESIAAIEQSFDVNSVRHNNRKIWPLIRLALYQQFSHPNQNFTGANTNTNEPIPIIRLKHEERSLLKKYQNIDLLFFSRGDEHTEKIDGKFYNPFIDSMVNQVGNNYNFQKLELIDHKSTKTLPRYNPTIMIAPSQTGFQSRTTESISNFVQLQSVVREITEILIDEQLFIHQARITKTWEAYFSEILLELKPRAVFVICYYHLIAMALIAACRKLNITTVDIQHGIRGDYHGLYTHWTRLPPEGYDLVPDYFWCWGKSSKNNVSKWHTSNCLRHIPIVGANLRVAERMKQSTANFNAETKRFYDQLKHKGKVILITLQHLYPNYPPLSEFCFEAISQAPKNWFWLIRLHPKFNDQENKDRIIKILTQYGIQNYNIDFASSISLYSLLKRCDHHITGSSSSAYEALLFNVPTTLIDPSGIESYEEDLKKGVFIYADNSQDLMESIHRSVDMKSAFNPSYYIDTENKTAELALDEILKFYNSENKLNKPKTKCFNSGAGPVTQNFRALNQLGEVFMQKGYQKAALNSFLSVIELNPAFVPGYYNLGNVFQNIGDNDKALRCFAKASELDHRDESMMKNVVDI